ncbi:MAG TPA: helix-turn-helix domain-containing protein [Thermoleophilaceae bacterium]
MSDKELSREPWRSLPAEIADVIEPELEATTDEILATIAREVPDYARPLEGSFGRGVRTGVTEALRQFVDLIRSPSGARGPGREVYVALGSGELHQGRTLDALQSAYRVGARVAWRRLAAAATREGVEPDVLSLLAESIFAYIETLSADSVEGYAEARARLEGESRHRRHALVAALVREPPADEADLRAAAEAVAWRIPRTAAALACDEEWLDRVAMRLPADTIAAGLDGVGCAIVPDPDGPGRPSQIERAIESTGTGAHAALGPTDEAHSLAASWAFARATLRAVEAGAIETPGLVRADDVLVELLLFENSGLAERITTRWLAPLAGLTPKASRRMEETALAYVQQRGNAAAMARALGVHPQTARYRLRGLRELLGDTLDDPDARFEMELALRAREQAVAS